MKPDHVVYGARTTICMLALFIVQLVKSKQFILSAVDTYLQQGEISTSEVHCITECCLLCQNTEQCGVVNIKDENQTMTCRLIRCPWHEKNLITSPGWKVYNSYVVPSMNDSILNKCYPRYFRHSTGQCDCKSGLPSPDTYVSTSNGTVDQFGRGHVLYISNALSRQPLGKYEVISYSNSSSYSLQFWFRLTFNRYCPILKSHGRGTGLNVKLSGTDDTLIIELKKADGLFMFKTKQNYSKAFPYWTNILITVTKGKEISLYVNGSYVPMVATTNSDKKFSYMLSDIRFTCVGGYYHDFAIWEEKIITQEEAKEFYSLNTIAWSNKKYVTAKSCKDLKTEDPSLTSSYYWIKSSGIIICVYCDMETAGGGWTMIGNLISTKEEKFIFDAAASGNLADLGKVSSGNFALLTSGLEILYNESNFQQIRFFCYKPSTNRTFHVMTATNLSGQAVVDYMLRKTHVRPSACGSFERLPDDASVFANDCTRWGLWSIPDAPKETLLYHATIFIAHVRSMSAPFYECDDGYTYEQREGEWKYYVR